MAKGHAVGDRKQRQTRCRRLARVVNGKMATPVELEPTTVTPLQILTGHDAGDTEYSSGLLCRGFIVVSRLPTETV